MKPTPLVSIVIDNYNYARYVGAAIESALEQRYPAVEVLVVDDGSSDASRTVIARYAGRVQTIFKENGGQASAFNAGFEHSQGEVVIFLDADDQLLPHASESAAGAFLRCPAAGKVQQRMEVIDGRGERTGEVKPAPHLPLPNGDLCRQALAFPDDIPWLPTSGNAFPAAVLRQIFPIPEAEYRILADFYLSHLTPLFGPVITLPEIGALYRVHGENNHEPTGESLNLAHIRQTLLHWQKSHRWISEYSRRLGLGHAGDKENILSVTYVAHRLISLRLAPEQHPFPKDSRAKLLRLGWQAAQRRFDAGMLKRSLFCLWFAAMAYAPSPLDAWLAEQFLFPQRRQLAGAWLNTLQGRMRPSGAPHA